MNTMQSCLAAGLLVLNLCACAPTLAQAETPAGSIQEASIPEEAAPPVAVAPALPPMTAEGSITLFEGGCYYGSGCDSFEITLYPTGVFTVAGANEHAGSSGNIGPETFADAEAYLAENGFAALPEWMDDSGRTPWARENPYPCARHAPAAIITRRPGDGTEQVVHWDMGCSSAAMGEFTRGLKEAMRVEEILSNP
mgnify:CR=1 FL=1